MRGEISRRDFVREAALGIGVLILANSRSARAFAANNKLNVALIGVGGRGKWFVDEIPKQANVVALCDVNESKATAAYREHPDVPILFGTPFAQAYQKIIADSPIFLLRPS